MRKITLIYILLNTILGLSYAESGGRTQADFLRIGIGAKAAAMGEAFTAICDNADALYWNPAGLSQIEKKTVSLSPYDHVAGIYYENIVYAQKIAKRIIGVGLNLLHTKDEYRDEDGNKTGTFKNYNGLSCLAYASQFNNNIYYGLSIKRIYMKYDKVSNSSYALDLGSLFILRDGLKAGIVLQNLSSKTGFEYDDKVWLPITLRTGLSYIYTKRGILALDLAFPIKGEKKVSIGCEYKVIQLLSIRVGYRLREKGNNLGGYDGLSGGIGFAIKSYIIDYAFIPFGEYENSHKVSLVIDF